MSDIHIYFHANSIATARDIRRLVKLMAFLQWRRYTLAAGR